VWWNAGVEFSALVTFNVNWAFRACLLVVDATQSQFHLYLAVSRYLARNSHLKGTPMLGGSAVKRDADCHPDISGLFLIRILD
jgi:hypothetical protein